MIRFTPQNILTSVLIITGLAIAPSLTHADSTNSDFTSTPLNLSSSSVPPLVMLDVSRDHQLSYKAYTDYGDLNNDGTVETSYDNSIDYYGYFDNAKCYTYDSTKNRFIPAELAGTGDKKHYCNDGSNKSEWSGNFLNWGTMTRMDVVRKILYGGERATSGDTATLTVLERQFLPMDAHAFAKYYGPDANDTTRGADISKLTPFTTTTTTAPSVTNFAQSITIPSAKTAESDSSRTIKITPNPKTLSALSVALGDQIYIQYNDPSNSNAQGTKTYAYGVVTTVDTASFTIKIPLNSTSPSAGASHDKKWSITNLSRTGITLCNLTPGTNSGADRYSETNTQPPLMRVVTGDYALWNANERWQCKWSEELTTWEKNNSKGVNGNKAAVSGLYANAQSPSQANLGLGTNGYSLNSNSYSSHGQYVLRVEACKNGVDTGNEHCKDYGSAPNVSSKPIGLLQQYGDTAQIYFGLMTGSYTKNISGGVLRKNIGLFTDEVNLDNGTFSRTNSDNTNHGGIVDNLNRIRQYGYEYYQNNGWTDGGSYIDDDFCDLKQIGFTLNQTLTYNTDGTRTGKPSPQGSCSSWGNPMSEIYLESLRYLTGRDSSQNNLSPNPAYDYTANQDYATKGVVVISTDPTTKKQITKTKDAILQLTTEPWTPPITQKNYCAPLNIIVFNASVSNYDGDQVDKWVDVCPKASKTNFPTTYSSYTPAGLTTQIGASEGINGKSNFVGNNDFTAMSTPASAVDSTITLTTPTSSTLNNSLCTSKTITAFGNVAGLCSEAPTQQGTYLLAGMAWYANTNRLPAYGLTIPSSQDSSRELKVSTYGVALATNTPKISVPVGDHTVTIMPSCRLDYGNTHTKFGGCTLVDFKIIYNEQINNSGIWHGKFFVTWEDSEMGGDYDQDMTGVISYITSGNQVKITTQVVSMSTDQPMGFGYTLSGTNKDGAHFFSGIGTDSLGGFSFTNAQGETECSNCRETDAAAGPSSPYVGAETPTEPLSDPLWYAAKWGGFTDKNDNNIPDQDSEWDTTINSTGDAGSDGLPDNFFYAANPLQLANQLNQVFLSILKRVSSGTAAAVVSNNVSGSGALYQAYYEPDRQDSNYNDVRWIGTLQAMWVDNYGYTRVDSNSKCTTLGSNKS